MSIFTSSKKEKWLEELEQKFSSEISHLRLELIEKINNNLQVLNEIKLGIDKLASLLSLTASLPKQFENQINPFIEKLEKISEELTIVRYYENMLLSVQEGIKDVVEVLNKERELIRQEVQQLMKEKTELEAMREEMKKWREELEAKEKHLILREEELKDLEERKRDLEQRVSELSQRYLGGIEEARSKLEEMVKEMMRDFKLREIRLERLVRREAELKESLAKLKEKEETLADFDKKLTQLKAEVTSLTERKRRLETEIREIVS
ncbi:MAG: hypothetical protein QW095_06040 [Nitrososphaerota archaeon]